MTARTRAVRRSGLLAPSRPIAPSPQPIAPRPDDDRAEAVGTAPSARPDERAADHACEMLTAPCPAPAAFLLIGRCSSGDVYSRQLCGPHREVSLEGTARGRFCCALCGDHDLTIVSVIPLDPTDASDSTGGGRAGGERA